MKQAIYQAESKQKDRGYIIASIYLTPLSSVLRVWKCTFASDIIHANNELRALNLVRAQGGATQRSSISFVRSFRLPADADLQSDKGAASASVKNGMLKLALYFLSTHLQCHKTPCCNKSRFPGMKGCVACLDPVLGLLQS
eukprot:scaffold103867_cov20-Tisochrysis_lutea.AAC.1